MTTTKTNLVKVVYWVGTAKREGLAADYLDAMNLATLNSNLTLPKFYEISTGRQLYDDGNGLRDDDGNAYVV